MAKGVLLAVVLCVLAVLPLAASADPGRSRPRRRLRSSSVSTTIMRSGWRGPDGLVAKYRDLGLEAVRLTIPWRRGQRRPTSVRVYLHRAAMLIERGQRVVVSVFGRPEDAPIDELGRREYGGFLHYVLVRIPFRDVAIWNEANSPQFWPTSAGAPATPWRSSGRAASTARRSRGWPALRSRPHSLVRPAPGSASGR